ncbi:erythromycin esterase family protein [Cesiribacter sp. SM1]|uniref:erythromycin esterase family protein n=1 Tax=Cesiribacter sp. SM1 TaxID=2861196 RepID=UPI001CD503AB|nr:erythromycin esterase family protein [Cesiribacter sp. SM1]
MTAQSQQIPEGQAASEEVFIAIPNHPLRTEADLDVLLQEIGDARIVLLGEASHGTSEYYTWRAAITKRLLQEKGFDFIAVEGEWADSYRVNQFIKGPPQDSAAVVELLQHYNRWPSWMWGNHEVAALVGWLNRYNQQQPQQEKAGFYGLDVYCLWEAMEELMPYLPDSAKQAQRAARRVDKCFQPYSADAQEYARAVANASANCRHTTSQLWRRVQKLSREAAEKSEALFVMEQNALVALNGERYYRAMVSSEQESWNIRDRHMTETLRRLLAFHGPDSKAIVWEHNTHVGDARYTDMAQSGMVNVGQLVREEFGEDVFIVGFGSYEGSVIAARQWGGAVEEMQLPPAPEGSWENMLHQLSDENKIILSRDIQNQQYLQQPLGHRAVGVVYHPNLEAYGNYVPSVIPKRYDAFLFIDKSRALHPISVPLQNEPPDLYPWGY